MSLFGFFSGDKKETTTNSTNTTENTTVADSYNTSSVLNQSLTKNISNIDASSQVNNFALDASKSYNLANVGNVSGGGDSGWLTDLTHSLDLNKFFDTTAESPAIDSMDFGGATNQISEKLKALTGLQSATLNGQADQTLAAKSDSPTGSTNVILWVIGLAIVGLIALALFRRK